MKKIFLVLGVWVAVMSFALSQAVAEEEELDVQWYEPSSNERPSTPEVAVGGGGLMLERGTYSHRRFGRAHGGEGMWRIHWIPMPGIGLHVGIRDTQRLGHQPGIDERAFSLGLSFNNMGGFHLTQFAPGFDLFLLTPRFHAEIGPTWDGEPELMLMSLGVAPLGLRATWCGSLRPFVDLRLVETTISLVFLEDSPDHESIGFMSVGASLGAGVIF